MMSVDGWQYLASPSGLRGSDGFVHDLLSRIHLVAGDNVLFATGDVNDKSGGAQPLCIYVVTPTWVIEVRGETDTSVRPDVTVHPRRAARSISILSAPIVTTEDEPLSGHGVLEFSVAYPFADVPVGHRQGTEEHRVQWLKEFQEDVLAAP